MLGRSWVGLGLLTLAFGAASANAQTLSQTAPAPVITPVPWDDGLRTPDLIDNGAATSLVTPSGVVSWTSNETWFQSGANAIDRIRVTSGSAALAPGAPVWLNPSLGDQIFDVSYTRGWPRALSVRASGYGVDVTPHAGVGLTSAGESAEAGATVRFGGSDALDELGRRGAPGHWYFYAQSSGRAVGYNLLRGDPAFHSANIFTQTMPGYMSDAEAGVAWRRGAVQAAFGYTQRDFYLSNMRDTGMQSHESVVGLTFSFRPGR
ncbi:MAG TPA: lipid A-modifier LpxR family protein [Caulobacteraceae bacterium]